MRTLGRRIIHLDPPRGFSAESVGALVLYTTAFVWQAPVSTTHMITSAIMGAGATKRFSAVRWGVARASWSPGADLPRGRHRRRAGLPGPEAASGQAPPDPATLAARSPLTRRLWRRDPR